MHNNNYLSMYNSSYPCTSLHVKVFNFIVSKNKTNGITLNSLHNIYNPRMMGYN